jgi:hypothetical protein
MDILLAFYAGIVFQIPRFYGDYRVLESECASGDEKEEEDIEGSGVATTTEPPCVCGVESNVREIKMGYC